MWESGVHYFRSERYIWFNLYVDLPTSIWISVAINHSNIITHFPSSICLYHSFRFHFTLIFAMGTVCSGFSCDNRTRCIPMDWRCDGHVDCLDQTDEAKCFKCANDTIYCGANRCMSSKQVCDGEINCPYGQDERNCGKWKTTTHTLLSNKHCPK